jgi:hypothetical protein
MGQPPHRVTAHITSRLRNVCPVSILFQPEEYAQGALIATLGQHDFVAFVECCISRSGTHDIRVSPLFGISFAPLGYGRNLGLFRSLIFSSLAISVSFASAIRAASR